MLDAAAVRLSEGTAKQLLAADRWIHDEAWRESLERYLFSPTVNIEGLVAGYTGPGGKTVLPHRAVAKLDLRLVPDMTFDGAVAALRAHLAKRGRGLGLRLGVRTTGCSGLAYKLEYADELKPEDLRFESQGVTVIVDPKSLPYLDGTELDFAREGLNEGFRFNNPNVKDTCGCGESFNV